MSAISHQTMTISGRTVLRLAFLLLFGGGFPTFLHAANVEIMLVDRLDEPRGYCLDIVGSQSRAMPERGLQAHTCYSYQGRIAVDQAFDENRIAVGVFSMPAFHVCVILAAARSGGPVPLGPCAAAETRRMAFLPDGRISPKDTPELCLTVAAGTGTPGGGGNPIHVLRKLTLENCSEKLDAFQKWRLRSKYD